MKMRNFLFLGAGMLLSALASADQALDANRSSLQFISVKNAAVAELHQFTALTGNLADDGAVQVVIDASSVATQIDIRDQRMRDHLLETAKFPKIQFSAKVDLTPVKSLKAGEQLTLTQPVSVALHGAEKRYDASLRVTRLADGALEVVTASPLLVNLADFQLLGGVEHLKNLAKLQSIATQVPVTARLVFR